MTLLHRLLCVLLLWVGLSGATPAAAQAAQKDFDHLSTGFALQGAHANVRCESCHLNGQLKGTPRDCASCHTSGTAWSRNNVTRSAQHVQTTQRCDSCHTTRSFDNARFDHAGVSAGTCASCHNGTSATGKNAGHLATTASCDSCHITATWSGARPDHSGYTSATDCASCHNGRQASGKAGKHMPSGSTNCLSCHGTASWKPSRWNHTQLPVAAQCASCHNGSYPPADGRPANHLPYQQVSVSASAQCDACHKSGVTNWSGARFHSNFNPSSQCATCHNGNHGSAVGKPANHLVTTAACEACHTSGTWAVSKVDHSGFGANTQCASCHNGSTATDKGANHMPVGSTNCFSCHSTGSWKPSKWNHSQTLVSAQCASCHTGRYPPADGKPGNHVPYQQVAVSASANCDACHKAGYGNWDPGRFHAYYNVSSQCSTCHTGGYLGAVGKPGTPIHNGVTRCEDCHKTGSWASSGKPDHSGYGATTKCADCHNGSQAIGKPARHVPVGLTNCYACHTVTAFKPSKWNHTQVVVTGQCANCHTGGYPPAEGKPATHVPYQLIPPAASANCDACHKAGYANWNPGRFHLYFSVSNLCSTCHTGNYLGAVGKPGTPVHNGVTKCEGCHTTGSWTSTGKPDHSGYGANTQCGSCHNGSQAIGKGANHIPVGTTNCWACHTVAAFKPSKWNHTQVVVTAQCASCHTGRYPPADGKPNNHVPYQQIAMMATANCDACHKAGYANWNPGRVHAYYALSTQCAVCHTGSYLGAVGKPPTPVHNGVTVCEDCHKSTSNWSNVQFKHAPTDQIGSGTCDNCHNGNVAKGKPANHIPVTVPTAKCDACHRSQVSFATAVTMNHTAVANQTCKGCHNSTYISQGLQAKPANHIPEAQLLNGNAMDCKACHNSTSNWGSMRMNHNGSLGGGAGWCKACHASGTNYLGDMERKSLTHEAKGKTPIDCSESGCHKPLGNKGSTYNEWD